MINKPATLLLLVGLFAAGGATGSVLTVAWMKRAEKARFAERTEQRRQAMDRFAERQVERLTEVLALTPEQRAKVVQISQRTREELERLRRESGTAFGERLRKMHEEIAAVLTPEQKPRFDTFQKEEMERMKRHMAERGERHGRPPGSPPEGDGLPPPPPPPER